jgi:hypothetical protein
MFIIAGKDEGFEYTDGKIIGPIADITNQIERLRDEGYRIFIVLKQVERIDEIEGA